MRESYEQGAATRSASSLRQVRSNKYLNDMIEQDHCWIKQRIRPMLGFRRFDTTAIAIAGIELAEKI